MKDKIYTEIICKGFCKYYKEGKEELHCNGYVFLRNNFTPYELKIMLENSVTGQKNKETVEFMLYNKDEDVISLVCKKCDFYIDECDYTSNRSDNPCGGYNVVKILLR